MKDVIWQQTVQIAQKDSIVFLYQTFHAIA